MAERDEHIPAGPRYWTSSRLVLGLLMLVGVLGPIFYLTVDKWKAAVACESSGPLRKASLGQFNTTNLQLPANRILPGGPRKDGIPSLKYPHAVSVADADYLRGDHRVIGVTINGESRAYPINVLNYHECANDELGGLPIAIVYCPLCDSASVLDRRLEGKTYEFGISGLLYNSNVLLYDRTDQGLWSQVGFVAVSGPNAGKSLRHINGWILTTFADWKGRHPNSTVLSTKTGYDRDYSADRYRALGYFNNDRLMFPVEPLSPHLANKTPVIGVKIRRDARAYPVAAIQAAEGGVVRDMLAGDGVELRASADISRSADTVEVVAVPEGAQVVHTFWFAWYAFHPETDVYGQADLADTAPSQ